MEAPKPARLHPLLTAAAISVTVFSAVGIGTLTGLLPSSIGSDKEAAAPLAVVEAPKVVAQPAAGLPTRETKSAARPARKPEAPKPVVQAMNVGTIESVREVSQPGETTGLGPVAGGVAGAVLGSQFGKGNGRKVLAVLGAAGGAYAGKEIEKRARATSRWEVDVRYDNGSRETVLSEAAPQWHAGDRVRVVEGRLQPV